MQDFTPCETETCIYTKPAVKGTITITVAIDDFILTAISPTDIADSVQLLQTKYDVNYLRSPTHILD